MRLIRDLPLRRDATIIESVAESGNVHLALFDRTDVLSNASAVHTENSIRRFPTKVTLLHSDSPWQRGFSFIFLNVADFKGIRAV
jgi:hypothetical protein